MFVHVSIFAVFLLGFNGITADDMQDKVKPCNSADPETVFNECLRGRIEGVIHDSGNDKSGNDITSIDPLVVNTINLGHNTIKMRLRGISNTKITAFMMNKDKCKIYAETLTPILLSEGEFISASSGSYIVPIDDEKTKNSTVENVRVIHIVDCEKYNKDGSEFLRITKYNFFMKPESALSNLNKLLDGFTEMKKDSGLNYKTTKYIRNSAVIGKKYGTILANVVNMKLETLPVNLLFI